MWSRRSSADCGFCRPRRPSSIRPGPAAGLRLARPGRLRGASLNLLLALARRSHPFSAAGGLDKLGPLYHLFAAMAAGMLSDEAALSRAAVLGESALRLVRWGRDVPDPEKALADRCGAEAALRLLPP